MSEWPRNWAIDTPDIAIGERLVTVEPFVMHLLTVLARKTIRRHLDYLNLLGGKIIADLNTGVCPENREKSGGDLILDQITEDEALSTGARKKTSIFSIALARSLIVSCTRTKRNLRVGSKPRSRKSTL
jgi:hypothetical protein